MIRVQQDPGLEAALLKELDGAMEDASDEAAFGLVSEMEAGPRSGIHWAEDPRQASARGEYPQEQRSGLVNSIDAVKLDEAEYAVGFFGENQFKLNKLEFGLTLASQGTPVGDGSKKGQRRPLYMFFEGRDSKRTHGRLSKAIRDWLS